MDIYKDIAPGLVAVWTYVEGLGPLIKLTKIVVNRRKINVR